MLEYLVIETIVRERLQNLAENAETHRLLQGSVASGRSLQDRLLILTANILISTGNYLLTRHYVAQPADGGSWYFETQPLMYQERNSAPQRRYEPITAHAAAHRSHGTCAGC